MIRGITRTLLLAGVLAGVLMTSGQADAGWYHWRGCGPYLGWCGYNYSYCAPTYCAPTYCPPTYCPPTYCAPTYTYCADLLHALLLLLPLLLHGLRVAEPLGLSVPHAPLQLLRGLRLGLLQLLLHAVLHHVRLRRLLLWGGGIWSAQRRHAS